MYGSSLEDYMLVVPSAAVGIIAIFLLPRVGASLSLL